MQQPEVKENVIFKTKIKQIAKPGKKRGGGPCKPRMQIQTTKALTL